MKRKRDKGEKRNKEKVDAFENNKKHGVRAYSLVCDRLGSW